MKNKKGFTLLYSLMLGLLLFFVGLAIAPAMKDTVHQAMGDTSLNCSTTDVTLFKASCTQIDFMLPLIVGICFGFAGFLIGGVFT
jgi:hypothetical protein